MDRTAQNFHIPQNLSLIEQVTYCKTIIQKLRCDQAPLREKAA